jgi:peptide/nickel transport system ATP-binding protein
VSALSVRRLRIQIDGVDVVDGIDLEVAPGECLALVGESGAGKSLTARAVVGLTPLSARVTADRLIVTGADATNYSESQWRRIRGRDVGLVSQDALVSLDPLRRIEREVAEPIEIHSSLRGADTARAVLALLERVAMPEPKLRARQYPHELSGGLRQRALIASALAGGPRLLVADEPTTALDASVQRRILLLLSELTASGIGLLLITHDLSVVERLADRVAVMRKGRIVESGTTAEVLHDPQHPYTRELLAAVPRQRPTRRLEPTPAVLEARALTKTYRSGPTTRIAVEAATLSVAAGTTLGIVGESGSGKSTLARMLLGLECADSGDVLLEGQPWSALSERERRSKRGVIQLIDQDALGSFDPRKTVGAVLAEALALTGVARLARRARAVGLLDRVGLSETLITRRPRDLSGGQRQRVAIARALARKPRILVCDEPVSALDVSVQSQVLALLDSLQQGLGLTIVFISHDLGVIAQVSDRIAVMKEGVIVEQGIADDILNAPHHPFTKELLGLA